MIITKDCPMCGRKVTISLSGPQEIRYQSYLWGHGFIQDLFPELNPMEREALKTGYCPDCQRKLFGTDYTSHIIKVEVAAIDNISNKEYNSD